MLASVAAARGTDAWKPPRQARKAFLKGARTRYEEGWNRQVLKQRNHMVSFSMLQMLAALGRIPQKASRAEVRLKISTLLWQCPKTDRAVLCNMEKMKLKIKTKNY